MYCQLSTALDSKDVQQMTEVIRQALPGFESTMLADNVRWQPHLVRKDPLTALHIHATSELRTMWRKKLAEAQGVTGCQLVVAAPIQLLTVSSTLEALDILGAQVLPLEYDLNSGSWSPQASLSVMRFVFENQLKMDGTTYNSLATRNYERAKNAETSHQKGKSLEELLGLIFSQISGFEVKETNYRTETEEIDIVVHNRAVGGYIWGQIGSPIVLAEAKNTTTPVGRKELSAFKDKLDARRGMCHLGFLVTMNRFSEDLIKHLLRYSHQKLVIPLIDGNKLDGLCRTNRLDDMIENIITDGILQ